jgi:transposase InsO family protein
MSRYRFIEAEKHGHAVATLCRVLEVSRAAYYRWAARPLSTRATANLVLLKQIREVHADSDGRYGSPRIHAELQDQGVAASRGRIARLMAAAGVVGRRARRCVRTTIPAKKRVPFDDLVARRFVAEAPNQLWCGDLTYIHTAEGFLYCASVIDVFSRRVIGWAIDTHMRAELVCEALRMAVANRRGQVAGVIFHSDRGAQYQAGAYQDLARRHGVRQSMGHLADCFDALAESTPWRSRSLRP